MVDWEVTATTIFCQHVNDEITVIINEDGTVKCSGRKKYEKPSKETRKAMKEKSRLLGKKLACLGDACPSIGELREKWLGVK